MPSERMAGLGICNVGCACSLLLYRLLFSPYVERILVSAVCTLIFRFISLAELFLIDIR